MEVFKKCEIYYDKAFSRYTSFKYSDCTWGENVFDIDQKHGNQVQASSGRA